MFTLFTEQDIEDFTLGCCFFATGGGGPPAFGQKMLLAALNAGKEIRVVEAAAIADDAWMVCPYLMGTSGPETEVLRQAKEAHGLSTVTVSNMPAAATRLLLQQHSSPITLSAIIPYEIGAAATASALATAAWLGVPTVDADFVGRAVPEIIQMLPVANGLDLCPVASADAYGNEVLIRNALNRQMTERIGKALAMASFGLVGQATLLRQAQTLKPFMLTQTLSDALKVGRAVRNAQGDTAALTVQLNKIAGSRVLFSGTIAEFNGADQDGYYVGDILIDNDHKDAQFKIWFKNENLISWLNGEVYVTTPDLISIIDASTGQPLINSQLKAGLKVLVFGTPSRPEWHSGPALKMLEPRYFGFDFDAKLLSTI